MADYDLKPCPFCGEKVSICKSTYSTNDIFGVPDCYAVVHPNNECILSGFTGSSYDDVEVLVEDWNREVSETKAWKSSKSKELKPCPYCNKDDNIKIYHRKTMFSGEKWIVCCAGYGCIDSEYVFAKSKEKAIEKWNKRSDKRSGTFWQEVKE